VPDPDVLHKAADLRRILISHDRKTMPTTLRDSSMAARVQG
jgi:hypothetical protein